MKGFFFLQMFSISVRTAAKNANWNCGRVHPFIASEAYESVFLQVFSIRPFKQLGSFFFLLSPQLRTQRQQLL